MNRCVVVPLVCGLVILAGCGSDDASSSASVSPVPVESDAPATAQSTVAPAGTHAIVDGTYVRTVVRAEAIAAGFDAPMVDEMLGPDGEMPLTFKFQGDRWTIFVTDDTGVIEMGDGGTQGIDDDGQLVQTSESEGCPGCVIILDWAVDGDTLTLKCAPGDNPECQDGDKVILEGAWVKSQ